MRKDKIRQILYLISLSILTLLTCTIIFMSINLNNAEFFSTFLYGYKVFFCIIFCACFVFIMLYILNSAFSKYHLDSKVIFPYFILFIIFSLQALFVVKMKVSLRYDTLKVFDEAVALLNGGTLSPEYSSGYFAKYPNNIPICIVTCLLLKLPKLFGIVSSNYMLYVQLVNVLLMDISFLFSFKLLCKIKNQKLGIMFLLLLLFNPLTYCIAPFYYTHTFSMVFSTGAIYFFVCCIQENNCLSKRLFYASLTGLLLSIGFKIRATVFIVAIALLLYLILNLKNFNKKSFIALTAFVGAVIVGFSSYYLVEQHYVKFNYNQTGYPATHWIMLGLQGTGGYNAADDAYTECFSTKAEKTKATEGVIIQRVKAMGLTGLLKLWRDKLEITWSDGTDDFIDNISMTADYSAKNDYISGSNNDILVSYCHIYYFMILFLMLISIIRAFMAKPEHYLYIVCLNLLGGILFHIFWEAGEVYSISFTCSIFVLAANGFDQCVTYLSSIKKTKFHSAIIASSTILTIFCIAYVGSKLTSISYTHYNYAMKQDLAEPDTTLPLLENTLFQTFKTSRSFNTVGVKVRNTLGTDNCSSYKFELLNSKDEVLYVADIIGAWAFDKDYYRIEFDRIVPNDCEEFKIKITPNIVSDAHFLTFQSYDTGNYDIYQNGALYINDAKTNSDLTFIVLDKIEQPFWAN